MHSLHAHRHAAIGGMVLLAFHLGCRCLRPFAAVTLGQITILTLPGLLGSPRSSISPQPVHQSTICLAVGCSCFSATPQRFRLSFQSSRQRRMRWRCGGFLFTRSGALGRASFIWGSFFFWHFFRCELFTRARSEQIRQRFHCLSCCSLFSTDSCLMRD